MHSSKTSKGSLGTFTVGMLSLAVVISLRNLPLTAKHGLSTLFYYVLAVLCFMVPYALISAELASFKPQGIYVWVRDSLGKWWGFFAVWMQWFHNMTWYPAMLAFIGSSLVYKMYPDMAQNKLYLSSVVLVGFWGLTFFNFFGISTSALFSTICVIVGTIIPGIILVSLALFWVFSGNSIAISLNPRDIIPDFGSQTSLALLAGMLLALCGLEANANLASDMRDPKRSYPKAVLIGAMLTLAILVLGSLSIAVVIPKDQISLVSGLVTAFNLFFQKYNLSWMTMIVVFMTIAGSLGELNAWMFAGTKGLFISTQNDCLPKIFKKTNSRGVPVNLMLFQAIVVTGFSALFLLLGTADIAYWVLSALSVQMYLMMYVCLFIAGPVLRKKEPKAERIFVVPGKNIGIYILSFLGILSCFFALFVSILPPEGVSYKHYTLWLSSGFLLNCFIPVGIFLSQKKRGKSF
ncbi:amino acid permease [Chlamydiifrater volucris]|uniref:amino acid permease n=1 Tax=Chlamydiifrater volucris TaxID=2681470 RepID=UPI001BCE0A5D|nr:amino acid permease [Chlamydiifrater volucris]